MRLIGIIKDQVKGQHFSSFLRAQQIPHELDIQTDHNWENENYGIPLCHIWIYDEEQFTKASEWLTIFTQEPENPIFRIASSELPLSFSTPLTENSPQSSWEKQPMGWITRTILLLCSLLFVTSEITLRPSPLPSNSTLTLLNSPIDKVFLYDYPTFYEGLTQFIRLYGYENLTHPENLPPQGRVLFKKISQTPYWQGMYSLFLTGGATKVFEGLQTQPLFEKIQEGQLWRFITPCFLHGDIFHLFFNMLWLMVLGKQIEGRLLSFRYILLICLLGVISNTAQYMITGPNFIGFSGVLCGMLGFIWMRQKYAPWEGYQLDRLTLFFMLIFVLGMAGIQITSFVLQKFFNIHFSANLANTAHIVGGLVGIGAGRISFFNWRQT
jgi:GlpG protein